MLAATCAAFAAPALSASPEILLRQNWFIASSADVRDGGAAISLPGYPTHDWYPATVPTTVLSALVKDQVYPEPYTGMNLRSIPGTTYPLFEDFSNLMMPPGSPFRHAWWYRTEFDLPAQYRGKTLWLAFDGINYRANVWMNGVQVATADKLAGMWRLFEFDVTAAARPGQANSLAVEVFPPQPRDLSITLVDWAPMPPDKEMGIWRDVHILATGALRLRYPAVITKLDSNTSDRASLTVRAELTNSADHAVAGVLKGKIETIQFQQPVRLGARETQVIRFTAQAFPQLNLSHPRLWWPAPVGPQNLYPLDLHAEVDGQVSDSSHTRFGVREVTSKLDQQDHRLFQVNGKNILIRGAGYSFDLLLRSSPEKQREQLQYVRDLNLNAVRMEGKLEDDHFFDLADEMGILMMPGWCCCDQWENWPQWDTEDEHIAAESMRDQARRLERHPSVFVWLYGSDFAPPPKVEKMYLQVLKDSDWPNPAIASASGRTTTVGPTGVKMTGPYEYVAPSFWYLDHRHGGAFGFNTETSPGPAIPPIESLRRMLPPDHLWPIDSVWEYHAGGMSRTLSVFTEALNKRYGPSDSAEEYSRKAQMQAYEAHRAMMESYGRNMYTSTGIIQWMLNNAWPSMIWHMYDWYLRPGGSYFGVKKACEPLHVQYSYDDRSIVVVNSYYQSFPGLKVTAKVYNLDMTEKFSRDADLDIAPDSSTRVFTLPEVAGLTSTYFVSLTLQSGGEVKSRNFYWLSTAPETIDFAREQEDTTGQYDISTWAPTKTFADYTALNHLPQVELEVSARSQVSADTGSTTVTLHNPAHTLGFGIRLKVNSAGSNRVSAEAPSDTEILPVLWQDNYFELLPGETRQITATYSASDAGKAVPTVEVEGWNVRHQMVSAQP
ncbi:MAG TPA: sugar-binding domain-containing protein [Terriglobales bacterium]